MSGTDMDGHGQTPTHIWVTGNHSKSRCVGARGDINTVLEIIGSLYFEGCVFKSYIYKD